jgi:hypothetical protein
MHISEMDVSYAVSHNHIYINLDIRKKWTANNNNNNNGTMLQAGKSRVRDPIKRMKFSIYLILPPALCPGFYPTSNRNEYQKQKNNVSGEQSMAGA